MQTTKEAIVSVHKSTLLEQVPSGSGLALVDSTIYISGDNSPYLFRLSPAWKVLGKHLLVKGMEDTDIIPKADKPDFESMTPGEWQGVPSLLIFASGSKSSQRDWLAVVPLHKLNTPQLYSLTPFYDQLALREGVGREEINLEGAVVMKDQLWLFNRGRNSVIAINWQQFSNYVQQGLTGPAPAFELQLLQLPTIQGKEARFSGACEVPGTSLILVSATVEDTDNWIDDGEILGSFIGVLNSKQPLQLALQQHWLLTNAAGEPLKDKLESLEVLEQQANTLKVLAVTDNDNGSSELLELLIQLEE